MPKLIVQNQGQEWTVELKQGSNVIGRQSTCDVPLKEGSLSRQHCDLVLAGSTAILVDKGSMNGTLVNGKKIKEQPLQPGDRIVLGQHVLWYEKKGLDPKQVQSRPAPAPVQETAPPAPTAQVATRRSVSPAPARAEGMPADYAFRTRGGGGAGRAAAAALAVAVLAGGAWFARGLFRSGPVAKGETGGLVRNGGFDGPSGKPAGWSLADKPASSISVDAGQGKGGGGCLVLDKSSAPGDHTVALLYDEVFALGGATQVEGSLQAKLDGFSGRVGLRVDWLRSVKGPVLAEEVSDPLARGGEWSALSASFAAPEGATAFRFGVSAAGRGGRILIDDVKLRKGAGGTPEKPLKLGPHVARATRQGVLQLQLRGQHALLNIQARLDSEKDGSVAQALAQQTSLTAQDNLLVVAGRLASPAGGADLEFEQQAAFNEGGSVLRWSFSGEALRQVERVSVAVTLPKGATAPDADTIAQARERITVRCEEGDVVFEYFEPAKLSVRTVDGRLRLVQSWAAEPQNDEVAVGFRVRDASGGIGNLDPVQAAAKLSKEGKSGEAQSVLRNYLPKIKEQALKDKVEQELRGLEEAEKRDWTELQASVFQATLLRRAEPVERARQAMAAYVRRWSGEPYDSKAAGLRSELGSVVTGSEADAERAAKLLERAKALGASGKRLSAELLGRTLISRYPTTEAAEGARELLKTLSP